MTSSVALPEQFGRYRILGKIGEGGMGAVWLAEDTSLGRQVALKVPHFAPGESPTVIERFRREARVAARINHPNLCTVYDVGEIDGRHYITMPYIEGTPLSKLVDADNAWPPRQAAELIRRLAVALQVMHDNGVMHRDLKPGNVLVKPSGDPVLMDFGLARSFDGSTRKLTLNNATLGTPSYMSPEQVEGQGHKIGPATDVYSLGVILFELLTGQVPFEGPLAVVFGQILHGQAPAPSSLKPGLDADLDALCLRAMAKKPDARFASMTEFAGALEKYVGKGAGVAELRAPVPAAKLVPDPAAELLRLTCPQCGKKLKVLAEMAGKAVKCPGCQARVMAGNPKQTQPAAVRDTQRPSATAGRSLADAPRPTTVREPEERSLLKRIGVWPFVAGGVGLLGLVVLIVVLASRGGNDPKPEPFVVNPPAIGFRVLPVPNLTLEPGQTKEVEVKIARDNLIGPVELKWEPTPAGFVGENGSIEAASDTGRLKIEADARPPTEGLPLDFVAVAGDIRVRGSVKVSVNPPLPPGAVAGHELRRFDAPSDSVRQLLFSTDGKTAFGWTAKDLLSWDVETGRITQRQPSVLRTALVPDGRAVTAGLDRQVRLVGPRDGQWKTLGSHDTSIWSLVASLDGKRVISVSGELKKDNSQPGKKDGRTVFEDCTLKCWDSQAGKELWRVENLDAPPIRLVVSADGKRVLGYVPVSDGLRYTLAVMILWDGETGKELRRLGTDAPIRVTFAEMALTSDGRLAALVHSYRTLSLWDTDTGRQVQVLGKVPELVRCLTFSADGRYMLIGGAEYPTGEAGEPLKIGNCVARLWDVSTGHELHRLEGHTKAVVAVAFSPDGRRALTSGEDNTVRLWELKTDGGTTEPRRP